MRASLWILAIAAVASCAPQPRDIVEHPRQPVVSAAAASPPSTTVLVRRPPRSSGRLDGDLVGRAVHEERDRLATCYRSAGGVAAGRGVVYALLDVAGSGRVRRVTIGHSDVRSRLFEHCVEEVLRSMPMPATGELSVIQAHVVFGATDHDEGRAMLIAYRESRQRGGDQGIVTEDPISVAGLRGRLQPCYERALRRSPGLQGRTELHLVLEEDGSVADAAFSSNGVFSDGLGRCVLGVVRSLRVHRDDPSVATLTYPVIIGAAGR